VTLRFSSLRPSRTGSREARRGRLFPTVIASALGNRASSVAWPGRPPGPLGRLTSAEPSHLSYSLGWNSVERAQGSSIAAALRSRPGLPSCLSCRHTIDPTPRCRAGAGRASRCKGGCPAWSESSSARLRRSWSRQALPEFRGGKALEQPVRQRWCAAQFVGRTAQPGPAVTLSG